jgi:hypothetical protein
VDSLSMLKTFFSQLHCLRRREVPIFLKNFEISNLSWSWYILTSRVSLFSWFWCPGCLEVCAIEQYYPRKEGDVQGTCVLIYDGAWVWTSEHVSDNHGCDMRVHTSEGLADWTSNSLLTALAPFMSHYSSLTSVTVFLTTGLCL